MLGSWQFIFALPSQLWGHPLGLHAIEAGAGACGMYPLRLNREYVMSFLLHQMG